MVERLVHPYGHVNPGQHVARLVDERTLLVSFSLTEREVQRLQAEPVVLHRANDRAAIAARVGFVSPEFDPHTKNVAWIVMWTPTPAWRPVKVQLTLRFADSSAGLRLPVRCQTAVSISGMCRIASSTGTRSSPSPIAD